MTQQNDLLMPTLTSFSLPNVPFAVIDPRELPEQIQSAFQAYLAGSAAPHPIYVYQHDYERFCLLVQQNKIQIQADNKNFGEGNNQNKNNRSN